MIGPKVRNFILANEELIDANQWSKIYSEAYFDLESYEVGEFTYAILEAGLHPLDYLSDIPQMYLCSTDTTECEIPSHINNIGIYAYCNTDIKEVFIPSHIKRIRNRAFADCDQLTTVNIQTGLEKLSGACFSGCDNLKSINFPPSLSLIGEFCFFACKNLPSEIYLTEGLEEIRNNAFVTTSIEPKTFYLPTSLKIIHKNAFDPESKLIVHQGSYAHEWVQTTSYEYEVIS